MRVKLTFESKVLSQYSTVLCGSYKSTTYREKTESGFVITMFKCLKPTVQFQAKLFNEITMNAIEEAIVSYITMDSFISPVFFTIEDGRVTVENLP